MSSYLYLESYTPFLKIVRFLGVVTLEFFKKGFSPPEMNRKSSEYPTCLFKAFSAPCTKALVILDASDFHSEERAAAVTV